MPLGACCLKKSILTVLVVLCSAVSFISCGGSKTTAKASGLPKRVLASQGVTSATSFGGMIILNGQNDTIPRVAPISPGTPFSLMVVSPSRNIAAAFDASSNTISAADTTKETLIGKVSLGGATSSF